MNKISHIKIAFIDIDGTLSNSNKKITNETSNSIKMAGNKGLITVLCSGRDNDYVYEYSKNANASSFGISCNGALIFDYKNDKSIYDCKMDFRQVEKIWDYCNAHNVVCILNSDRIKYCNESTYEDKNTMFINDIYNINIYQVVVIGKSFETIYNLDNYIKENTNFKVANASNCYVNKDLNGTRYFLDLTNKDVNKGVAINKLLSHLNLKKENAIGFGDHINDFDLFNSVGYKVAMENAKDELKKKSDFITLSNDNDGVAYFLNNFIDYE